MVKKIVLFALLLIPAIGFAQEKIAYFKSYEVIPLMPEAVLMADSLKKVEAQIQAELDDMVNDYQKKQTAFYAQQDSLSTIIKTKRLAEIEQVRNAIETLQRQGQQSQMDLQSSLFAPIEAKVRKALEEVGTENHYAYIINADPQNTVLLFISPQSPDATPMVKAKLGLK